MLANSSELMARALRSERSRSQAMKASTKSRVTPGELKKPLSSGLIEHLTPFVSRWRTGCVRMSCWYPRMSLDTGHTSIQMFCSLIMSMSTGWLIKAKPWPILLTPRMTASYRAELARRSLSPACKNTYSLSLPRRL